MTNVSIKPTSCSLVAISYSLTYGVLFSFFKLFVIFLSFHFFSYCQHLIPAAAWSVATRFLTSGCFKCHYYLIRVLTWLCARFLNTTSEIFTSPICFLDFCVGVGASVIGLSHISSFFSSNIPFNVTFKFVNCYMIHIMSFLQDKLKSF